MNLTRAIVITREIFPGINDDTAERIIYNETTWPSLYGFTPEQQEKALRDQLNMFGQKTGD